MTKIDVQTGELGTTRVFSLSMPSAQARALRDSVEAQFAILGGAPLNPDGLEVFALADLGEIGLTGYLREGTDAREEDLNRDAAKLAALEGWVMLVHSLAFGGNAMTLMPDRALTLIGTYAQTATPTEQIAVTAEAAQPYSGTADVTAPQAPDTRRGGSLIVALSILFIGLILWWALF